MCAANVQVSAAYAAGPDPHESAGELARTVSTIMRDGIAAEKYLTLASLEKMGIGAGLATATYMGAMASTIHFRDGEFNFLRARRDLGVAAALAEAERAKSLQPGRPGPG